MATTANAILAPAVVRTNDTLGIEPHGTADLLRTADEQDLPERFSHRYEFAESELLLDIQRSACGCNYSATSWTTGEEARMILDMLELSPGRRLLEVGTGAGWPGLYLAHQAHCDVALVDLPISGLQAALRRARDDEMRGACWAVAGDGVALPFRNEHFDAIVHSDVLCCLVPKLEVLRSCRRVIRRDGKLVFSVILISPGLSAAEYRDAAACGPPFIESTMPYSEMLEASGWIIHDHLDLTPQYRESLGAVLDLEAQKRDELVELLGEAYVADSRTRRQGTFVALARGLIRRELFRASPDG